MCNLCREQEQIELAAWKALGIPLASEHAIAETPVTKSGLPGGYEFELEDQQRLAHFRQLRDRARQAEGPR